MQGRRSSNSLPRGDRRMFTSRRDLRRLGRYLLIYRARRVIYGRENVWYAPHVSRCVRVYTPRIRNPKLQETVRLRLSKSRVRDIFHGMKDEKGVRNGWSISLGKLEESPSREVSKSYSNLR